MISGSPPNKMTTAAEFFQKHRLLLIIAIPVVVVLGFIMFVLRIEFWSWMLGLDEKSSSGGGGNTADGTTHVITTAA